MEITIGEMSKRTGLSIPTLRYYEKEGLLINVHRTSGIRKYDESNINAIYLIECLKKSGLQLNEIKHFMDLYQKGDETILERYEIFLNAEKRIQNQMEELKSALDLIEYKKWYYSKAKEDKTTSIVSKMKLEDMPIEIQTLYKKTHNIK